MTHKRLTTVGLFFACFAATGCSRAPSIDIIGSFFPAWMLCLTIALFLVGLARLLLREFQVESEVGPLALFYPVLVTLFTSMIWLVFFR